MITENYEFGHGIPPRFVTLREIFPYFHRPTLFGFMLLDLDTGERKVLKKKSIIAKFDEDSNLDYYLYDITVKSGEDMNGESMTAIVVTVTERPITRIGLINPLKEFNSGSDKTDE